MSLQRKDHLNRYQFFENLLKNGAHRIRFSSIESRGSLLSNGKLSSRMSRSRRWINWTWLERSRKKIRTETVARLHYFSSISRLRILLRTFRSRGEFRISTSGVFSWGPRGRGIQIFLAPTLICPFHGLLRLRHASRNWNGDFIKFVKNGMQLRNEALSWRTATKRA